MICLVAVATNLFLLLVGRFIFLFFFEIWTLLWLFFRLKCGDIWLQNDIVHIYYIFLLWFLVVSKKIFALKISGSIFLPFLIWRRQNFKINPRLFFSFWLFCIFHLKFSISGYMLFGLHKILFVSGTQIQIQFLSFFKLTWWNWRLPFFWFKYFIHI